MYLLADSRPTPEENLALDEALLELAERHSADDSCAASEQAAPLEVLRLWQMPRACVVVGRSSRLVEEVHLDRCEREGIPVLRRMSGGASIVAGPGCLMYSVLLSLGARPECRHLDRAHRLVMETHRAAVARVLERFDVASEVQAQGTCDLTLEGRKFSGNSLRVKKRWLLYHGTFLLGMPVEWIGRYLTNPPKQPEYREGRSHEDFVTSLPETMEMSRLRREVEQGLEQAWGADRSWDKHPWRKELDREVAKWMEVRYCRSEWHRSR